VDPLLTLETPFRGSSPSPKTGALRTLLAGALLLRRSELVRDPIRHLFRKKSAPFSDNQITLVQNFAAQAVIALGETPSFSINVRNALDDLTQVANDSAKSHRTA